MELSSLKRSRGLERARRVGRGGKRGKTSGRGGKGQTARAGAKLRPEWRDLIKKIPKRRGYGRNRSRTVRPPAALAVVNFAAISKSYKDGDLVTPRTLISKSLVRRVSGRAPKVKVLGTGELDKKLIFQGLLLSDSAKKTIEAKGGTIR